MRFAILTISDRSSRGERPDASGPALARLVNEQGWQVVRQTVVPDDFERIRQTLAAWADSSEADREAVDVILTSGGTGFSPRDITPEACARAGGGHAGCQPADHAACHAVSRHRWNPPADADRQPTGQSQGRGRESGGDLAGSAACGINAPGRSQV
jgi:molybdenum cofactor synthesis domain-containing protein